MVGSPALYLAAGLVTLDLPWKRLSTQEVMKKLVTLQDIAAELGVSHATVSRALNGHAQISKATRERVFSAAERIGYVVNASARSLRGSASTLMGLVIPDVQNTVYAHVAKIVAETLAMQGYRMVLSVTEDDPEREHRDLKALAEARVAGVVVVLSPSATRETLALLAQLSVVQLLRRHSRVLSDVVCIDDHDATYRAASHLISLGHRRLAYVGNPSEPNTGKERLQGFLKACAESGMPVPPERVQLGPPSPNFGKEAIGRAMRGRHRPTGIVTGGIEQVLGILQWMNEKSLHCPSDFSLVGFGDSPWFNLIQGGITTMHLPTQEVSSAAAALLMQHAKRTTDEPDQKGTGTIARYSTTLIVRGSSGAPP